MVPTLEDTGKHLSRTSRTPGRGLNLNQCFHSPLLQIRKALPTLSPIEGWIFGIFATKNHLMTFSRNHVCISTIKYLLMRPLLHFTSTNTQHGNMNNFFKIKYKVMSLRKIIPKICNLCRSHGNTNELVLTRSYLYLDHQHQPTSVPACFSV